MPKIFYQFLNTAEKIIHTYLYTYLLFLSLLFFCKHEMLQESSKTTL